jgi:spermidine/putrescine transport system substrate-binding protein
MKRRALLLGLAGCGRDPRPRLNVYNWSDYIDPGTIPAFERETGSRVRYGTFESNEEMLAKIFGGNSGWDVVFPANSVIHPMLQNGLLATLRHDLLPNMNHVDADLRHPAWDPQLRWSIPYMWGSTGIVYSRKIQPPPQGWRDLWHPRLRGRLTMLDDPAEAIGAALLKLGYALNSTEPGQLMEARGELVRQKPLVRAYVNAEVRDQVVAGDVLAAHAWSVTAGQAIAASPDLAFVHPQEGFALYSDCVAILRESRRAELAHRFLDFLLRPDVAARNAVAAKTATANASARALLPASVRENPTLYPPPHTLARGEWFQALPSAAQRLRDRIWTEIKAA